MPERKGKEKAELCFGKQRQERKDKRIVILHANKGIPEGKDERKAGLCLRKGKDKRMAQKNREWYFLIKGHQRQAILFQISGTSTDKVEQTDMENRTPASRG